MVLYNDHLSPSSRPLLPSDEDELNIQLLKSSKIASAISYSASPSLTNSNELILGQRSSSNRNMEDLLVNKSNVSVPKALTDTNNFIEIFNKHEAYRKRKGNEKNEYTIKENYQLQEEIEYNNEDQISLGNIDNTNTIHGSPEPESLQSLSEMKENKESDSSSYGMKLESGAKKRYDDWAEKGAAKIVQEVINPKTGEKSKKLIKKGIKDFKFGDMIGDGAYSTVLLATSIDTGKKYAVKVLNKAYLIKQKKVKYVNVEKNALQRVNNSNCIIRLFFTFQDEASLYFLLEYAPNGDFLSLMKKLGSLNETAACYYSAQIIDSIDFLHVNGIIHRDIKPENILLDKDWKIKLTDFGTAKVLEQDSKSNKYDLLTRSKSFVGTAEYVSPELLNDSYVDYRCDIWAFGCILFQMIAGKPPFKATNEYLTFQKVMKVQYAFTAGFPTIIRDLVKRILVKPINQRLSISQIEKHPFYKEKNFKDGSIWIDPIPELSAYKVNAKSMLPMPELKDTYPQYKRTVIPYGKRSVSSSSVPSVGNSLSASTSGTGLSSTVAPRPNSSHALSSKESGSGSDAADNISVRKVSEERTSARRSVSSRKQQGQSRTPSGAALAANLAFKKKTAPTTNSHPSTPAPTQQNGNDGASSHNHSHGNKHGHGHGHNTMDGQSDNSQNIDKISSSDGNLNAPNMLPPDIPKHSASSVSSSVGVRKTPTSSASSRNGSSAHSSNNPSSEDASKVLNASKLSASPQLANKIAHANVNKMDIPWSYFLKNIGEHVQKIDEFDVAVIDSELLEKKMNKYHKFMSDPQLFTNHARSTLLSQVARSGGEITGLRNGFFIPEDRYYNSNNVDMENIRDEFRCINNDLSTLLYIDSDPHYDAPNTNTTSPNGTKDSVTSPQLQYQDDTENENIPSKFSGKVKKLFLHAKQSPLLDSNTLIGSDQERFSRRILVLTNYGRALLFVRRKTLSAEGGQSCSLLYEIDLCQISVNVKEALMNNSINDLMVIQTPYKSFVLHGVDQQYTTTPDSLNNIWFKSLKKCIKMGSEYKKHLHPRMSPNSNSPADSSSSTMASTSSTTIGKSYMSSSIRQPKITSPQTETPESPVLRSSDSSRFRSGESSKHSLFSQTINNTSTNRKSRIFDSYVSSREKSSRKQTKPTIPQTSKLVNGLPSTSPASILGLGLSSSTSNTSSNLSSKSRMGFRYK